jgi:hypothetical protein
MIVDRFDLAIFDGVHRASLLSDLPNISICTASIDMVSTPSA